MAFFRSNPFPVKAHFDFSITLTFAVPVEELRNQLGPGLEPDSYQNEFGFLAVAFVKTKELRPTFMPKLLGKDFLLVGYRYFVRFRNQKGRNLRGLRIIRSETDKKSMKLLGSILTPYQYCHLPLRFEETETSFRAVCDHPQQLIDTKKIGEKPANLPSDSIFEDWKQARKFCGPMPFTFSHRSENTKMLMIEGIRKNWKPQAVAVNDYQLPYLEKLPFSYKRLSAAFMIQNVDYSWKKGIVEAIGKQGL